MNATKRPYARNELILPNSRSPPKGQLLVGNAMGNAIGNATGNARGYAVGDAIGNA